MHSGNWSRPDEALELELGRVKTKNVHAWASRPSVPSWCLGPSFFFVLFFPLPFAPLLVTGTRVFIQPLTSFRALPLTKGPVGLF